jgi:hypothetical protein
MKTFMEFAKQLSEAAPTGAMDVQQTIITLLANIIKIQNVLNKANLGQGNFADLVLKAKNTISSLGVRPDKSDIAVVSDLVKKMRYYANSFLQGFGPQTKTWQAIDGIIDEIEKELPQMALPSTIPPNPKTKNQPQTPQQQQQQAEVLGKYPLLGKLFNVLSDDKINSEVSAMMRDAQAGDDESLYLMNTIKNHLKRLEWISQGE